VEGHLVADQVHILISILSKHSVSQVFEFIKGKSAIAIAIAIARNFIGRMRGFTRHNFWALGYYIRDDDAVRNYVCEQKDDKRIEQLDLF
jgi:putative transposase